MYVSHKLLKLHQIYQTSLVQTFSLAYKAGHNQARPSYKCYVQLCSKPLKVQQLSNEKPQKQRFDLKGITGLYVNRYKNWILGV